MNRRIITTYKQYCFEHLKKLINAVDKVDNFETLSNCTEISHMLSGNIIKEDSLTQNSINEVKRNNNFLINLN